MMFSGINYGFTILLHYFIFYTTVIIIFKECKSLADLRNNEKGQYYNKTSILEGDEYVRINPTVVKQKVLDVKNFEQSAKKKKRNF